MNELALFAGAGGGILGGHLLGWRTVAAVEIEDYPRRVLLQRQADGFLPRFPIWDDVRTFDGKPWSGKVDVISGGFPCQDISVAGNGAGLDGDRSGMWREMARIIGEVRPQFAFVENSPMLVTRGLERVLADLTAMGYDSRWGVISAADIGAKHKRERIWIVANSKHNRYSNKIGGVDGEKVELPKENRQERSRSRMPIGTSNLVSGRTTNRIFNERKNVLGDTQSTGFTPCLEGQRQGKSWRASIGSAQWWEVEPPVDRVADGMVDRVDRLKAIGNGQVPLCAATAWRILNKE